MSAGKIRAIVAIACLFLYPITPLYAALPWLHVDGNQIKDPNGNVVVLRGIDTMDLGATELRYGGAINMINRLTNKTDTQGSSPGWYPRVIRLAVYPSDMSDFTSPFTFTPGSDTYYNTLLRPVVDYCAEKGLYAIIDWHYVANTYDHVASTSQFWTYMAPKFADDSHVLFELFNEPINNTFGSDTANWLSVKNDMQTWINIVRTYAPNNLILVAGPSWSQAIGPAATYPVSGDNIVYVSHIYPGHWLSGSKSWYTNHITTCAAVYPVFMSEWGFSTSASYTLLNGTITNYGQPLMDFVEGLKISSSAWIASYDWEPPIFYSNWTLRVGEGEMGGFLKDTLYLRRNDDQPNRPAGVVVVTKCTVTAGSKDYSDKISFSGTMDAKADDFNDANNTIKVTIYSDDIVKPCDQNFPINGNTFKKGKYNYSKTENGVRKSFTYNVKTNKFAFAASNVDLWGLSCPLTICIEIGDYIGTAEVNEAIVNGSRMPIPIKLMMGVRDVLRVDNHREPGKKQLSVSGGFAVEDPNVSMANRVSEDLVITLGTQQFTIPANKLKAGRDKFTCSRAQVTDGGFATAEFNFKMCSFILTIKKINITAGSGAVDFCVAFAGYSQCVQITLP